jgi:Protein of unknown function (DUF3644)/EC042_2821-lke REase
MRPSRHSFLVEKAIHAAVAAIEIYNKPGFRYREESFAILMLNAWELILKARIVKENKNDIKSIEMWEPRRAKSGVPTKRLFPRKNRAGNNMTISVTQAVQTVAAYASDPIDRYAVENISLLIEVRDNAVHFVNTGKVLHKKVQEIGSASLRNFAYAAKTWFRADLEAYHFALMPVAFETPLGTLKTVFAENPKGAAGRLAKLLAEQESAFPFDPSKPYNVGVEVELRFVRKPTLDAINVKVDPADPNAIPVTLTEEDVLKRYPWTYRDLLRETKKKLPNLKFNSTFNKVMASCEVDKRYCHVRQLDPRKNKSSKQKFYSPNIVAELEKNFPEP